MTVNKGISRLLNRLVLRAGAARGLMMMRRLEKQTADARRINEETLMRILRCNETTELGRQWNMETIRDVRTFQEKIPLTDFDFYYDWIQRMVDDGENGLITNFPIIFFAVTSGTTGISKRIPISKSTRKRFNDLAAYRALAVMHRYYKQKTGKTYPAAKGFITLEVRKRKKWNNIGGITTLPVRTLMAFSEIGLSTPREVMEVSEPMDTRYLKTLFALAEHDLLFIAGTFMSAYVEIFRIIENKWEMFVADIRSGTINPSVQASDEMRAKLEQRLHPDPQRADELQREFEKGFDTPIIPRIWKSFSFISGIGSAGFSIYTDEMRKYAGDIPFDFAVFGASEGLFAVCFEADRDQFLMLPDSAFYEFLPVDPDDDRVYLIYELTPGREYELVLTNESGFCRYCIRDVIKVVEYRGQCPVVEFSYRRNQLLNVVGEKTSEAEAQAAIKAFAEETGCRVDDFCFYIDNSGAVPRYAVVIEDHQGTDSGDPDAYAESLDRQLAVQNHAYGYERRTGGLGPLKLRLTDVPINALYREAHTAAGNSDNQLKPLHLADTDSKREKLEALIARGSANASGTEQAHVKVTGK